MEPLNKSPRGINHKATKSKTNTRTIALERTVEKNNRGFKALLQPTNFTLGRLLPTKFTLNNAFQENISTTFNI